MATIEEVTKLLDSTRIGVTGKVDDHFDLVLGHRTAFRVLDAEIDRYISIRDSIRAEPATALSYPGYYEHMVELGRRLPMMRTKFLGRASDGIELVSQDASLSVTFSRASTIYILATLIHGGQSARRRLFRPLGLGRERQGDQLPHICDVLGRIWTIRVQAKPDSAYFRQPNQLGAIAESALFNLAYGYGEGLVLAQDWERRFEQLARRRNEDVQFPRRVYNRELTSHYQLAISTDSLYLGYIALYKIIEYFYGLAAEMELHRCMVEKLVAPDFSYKKPSQLRQLAALIRKHDQKMDEQRMLRSVLEQYFAPDEILTWVKEYEAQSGAYYSIEQRVFGQTYALDTNPNQIHASLARRIYCTRNALVHHKEGELARFIPFEGQEEIIGKEIPILLFLAESLIVKTGKDV